MSIKDSSKTGDKSQVQIDIEKKLDQIRIERKIQEDLVFGKKPNPGETPPEEGGDIPWTTEEKMKRFKIIDIHYPAEPEKLNGSEIPPYSPYRSEGMKKSIEVMIGEPLTDKWKWTFQGEPMLTKEQMDKDHKEAINIRDLASMHKPGEKGIKDQAEPEKQNKYNPGKKAMEDIKSMFEEDFKKGKKESDGKTTFNEIDWDFIEDLSNRMDANTKYPPLNYQKGMDVKELAKATLRHCIKILQPIPNDPETVKDHIEAIGSNAMMMNYQVKKKS